MRRFLLGLVAYGCALSLLGGALGISEAEARTLILAKCKGATAKVAYPHLDRSRFACYPPGQLVRLKRRFALAHPEIPIVVVTVPW